jgi:RecA/RadA recombinase
MLPFLKTFKKEISKIENVSTDFRPPSLWYASGNYAINKILSGSYQKAIPQGRCTVLAGPSDSGKSYLLTNILAHAQKTQNAFVMVLDSENALDYNYLHAAGVDTTDEKFQGISVLTISDVVSVVSDFIKLYTKEYGKYNDAAPNVIICLDSVDMLLTDAENEHFNKGDQKGDQGQKSKQIKQFLKTMVSRIKALNISFVCTHHVYPADPLKGEGLWAINNAIRYSASQIALITRLKLKEGDDIVGIRMKVETFKSRFAQIGTKTEVEVPRSTGMNPFSGLLDLLVKDGVVTVPSQGWFAFENGEDKLKFQKNSLTHEMVEKFFQHPKLKAEFKQFEDIFATAEPDLVVEDETEEV